MNKYDPLKTYLQSQKLSTYPMTFEEIERIIDAQLPSSAYKYRPWWSNNPNNSVMTRAWLDAGFESEQVDMKGRKLVFRRKAGNEKPERKYRNIEADAEQSRLEITISDLDPRAFKLLSIQAKQNECSIEDEAKRILTRAFIMTPEEKVAFSRSMIAQTPPGPMVDPAALIREDRDSR